MRQRVHETGLPEVFYGLSFVLTPSGIRTRWDRSGPNVEDNVYVDRIRTIVADPDWAVAIQEAKAQVDAMLAEREAKRTVEIKAATAETRKESEQAVLRSLVMPKVSWTKPVQPESTPVDWDEAAEFGIEDEEDLTLAYDLALEALIREAALESGEAPDSMNCAKDPETEVDSWACVGCPFALGCYGLTADIIGEKVVEMFGPDADEETKCATN
jgi:hypothetical protein